jgi:carbon storage regulator
VLVIRRKTGDRIVLDNHIEIEVLEARQNYVKLGISAPASVVIVRKEAQLTRELNLKAARTAGSADIKSLVSRFARKTSDEASIS